VNSINNYTYTTRSMSFGIHVKKRRGEPGR
jgi:hypothetical protein